MGPDPRATSASRADLQQLSWPTCWSVMSPWWPPAWGPAVSSQLCATCGAPQLSVRAGLTCRLPESLAEMLCAFCSPEMLPCGEAELGDSLVLYVTLHLRSVCISATSWGAREQRSMSGHSWSPVVTLTLVVLNINQEAGRLSDRSRTRWSASQHPEGPFSYPSL